MWNMLRRLFARPARATRVYTAKPALEGLETRAVPSVTTLTVASEIVNSPEHFADFVNGEYLRFLRRPADAAGLSFFVASMEQGLSAETVEADFVSSTEYILDHGNNATLWLSGLYNDLLGRTPDVAGLNSWLNALAAGATPFQVAAGFVTSVERETIVIRQDYAAFLGRAPDAAGLNHWLSVLQGGFSRSFVASGILASTEFFQRSGNTNSDFVIATFEDVLNRIPSASELAVFLAQLGTPLPLAASKP
jgi:Domain of unknown function (DUF4214)